MDQADNAVVPQGQEAEKDPVYRLIGGRGYGVVKFIGLEMEVSAKKATGRFVVNEKSCQPFGVLHGGVTACIAESIVSAAGFFAANGQRIAGIELNVSHLRAVRVGTAVTVTAKPVMQGKRVQVWEVKFEAENVEGSRRGSTGTTPGLFLAAVARVTLIVGLPVDEQSQEALSSQWSKL